MRGRVKPDVVHYRRERWINDFEGLDGPIKVLIKDGVLIVPYTGCRPCHLVTDKEDPIVTRIRFDLAHGGACPSLDGRLHTHRRTGGGK